MTAFELLTALLVLGFIAALFGYAGGAGARLSFSVRLDRVEGAVMQVLNRAKGAKGGEVAQVQRERLTSREKEAEALAAKLSAVQGKNAPRFFARGSVADQLEDESMAEIEREQEKARAAAGKK